MGGHPVTGGRTFTTDPSGGQMMTSILKTAAYTRAPKTTFTVLHPRKALKIAKLRYDIRHAYAPRIAAIGAFALALPVGYLLGRRGNGRSEET